MFELLTGIKPSIVSGASPFEIGDVIIHPIDKKPYVVVYNTGGNSYAVNSTGDGYVTHTTTSGAIKANLSEVGEFAKQLLSTSGFKFLNYCNTSFNQTAGQKLLEALKLTDLL